MPARRVTRETMAFDKTRQGVRDLDRAGDVLPYSVGPEPESIADVNVGRAERWASALAGGAALAVGAARHTLPGWGLALVGGALLARGLAGRCLLYRALGVNTAERSERSSDRETACRVSRP